MLTCEVGKFAMKKDIPVTGVIIFYGSGILSVAFY
jgi:hypothetical protein